MLTVAWRGGVRGEGEGENHNARSCKFFSPLQRPGTLQGGNARKWPKKTTHSTPQSDTPKKWGKLLPNCPPKKGRSTPKMRFSIYLSIYIYIYIFMCVCVFSGNFPPISDVVNFRQFSPSFGRRTGQGNFVKVCPRVSGNFRPSRFPAPLRGRQLAMLVSFLLFARQFCMPRRSFASWHARP